MFTFQMIDNDDTNITYSFLPEESPIEGIASINTLTGKATLIKKSESVMSNGKILRLLREMHAANNYRESGYLSWY